MEKDEIFTVINEEVGTWSLVMNAEGELGYVPCNFVQKL